MLVGRIGCPGSGGAVLMRPFWCGGAEASVLIRREGLMKRD